MQYRKEIDGLRAVAIVPVVLFHAGFAWFGGGYVGVDVFFVISGYLITGLILSEKDAGRFALLRFYERRARRILPALFLVMLVCLPFAWFWMTAGELKEFGEGTGTVSLFVSNILYFFRSGYFARIDAENPLLHTWSLAVEEQYYLLFPLFVGLLRRFGRRWLGAAIAAIAMLSFLFAHLDGSLMPSLARAGVGTVFEANRFGFFLTPARAWELMAGALIAVRPLPPSGRWMREAGTALGLVAIACAVFIFDGDTPSPSYYTLLPVLGAVLVIVFASAETLAGRLLTQPALVGMGLISYSVYLWHQPLFAFARLHSATPPGTVLLAVLAVLSVGLGYLSWRYVERPFRDSERFTRAQIFTSAAIGSLFFLCVGVFLVLTDGAPFRFSTGDRELVGIDAGRERQFVVERFYALAADFSPDGRTRVLIVGDSAAQDFANMVFASGSLRGYQIRTFYVPTACQIVLPTTDSAYCRPASLLSNAMQSRLRQAHVVILVASWRERTAARLRSTLAAAGIREDQRLFVVGAKGFGTIRPMLYLGLSRDQRIAYRNAVPRPIANDILRGEFPPSVFIDTERILCGTAAACPVFTPGAKLVSFDGSHLTAAGAGYAGRLLFTRSALATLAHK